uniref:Small ribosomal subunit protein uS3c n=1 Tax=Biomphalaria glabrata TaxID=6526 RepID=A0A2C9JR51_BIOGL
MVGDGPTLKRMHPRARGRSGAILKRSCNINITLSDNKVEDSRIREAITKIAGKKNISEILIERIDDCPNIVVMTAMPGLVLKKNGEGLESIKKELTQNLKLKKYNVEIQEVENLNLDAQSVASSVAEQIENRVSHRVAQKKAIANVMGAGALGIKIKVSGRLGGVDMAREEGYTRGKVPMQTLRGQISYGFAEAKTKYGQVGVKV